MLVKTCFFICACLLTFRIEALTIEDKVGQLIIAYFNGEVANELSEKLIVEARISGFIYYDLTNVLKNPQQVRQLSASLQNLAKIHNVPPLFICIDQEGGRVARLKEGFTQFPSNGEVGKSGKPELAYNQGKIVGKELKEVGINMNFAPVVDVNSNPNNPVIGNRSFGSDPKIVAIFGCEAVQGHMESGVIPVIKHFPGYGEVSTDPHYTLPSVDKSLAELDEIELFPFVELSNIAPAMMTGHMMLPKIDPLFPATLSKKIITGLLRVKIGYDGVLITDSLVMNAIYGDGSNLIEIAIKALEAGHDIVLVGGREFSGARLVTPEEHIAEVIKLHHGLVEAVKAGILSEERIDASLRRINRLKSSFLDQ
jgi:beta-N-acetylhexosaminidase